MQQQYQQYNNNLVVSLLRDDGNGKLKCGFFFFLLHEIFQLQFCLFSFFSPSFFFFRRCVCELVCVEMFWTEFSACEDLVSVMGVGAVPKKKVFSRFVISIIVLIFIIIIVVFFSCCCCVSHPFLITRGEKVRFRAARDRQQQQPQRNVTQKSNKVLQSLLYICTGRRQSRRGTVYN